MAACLVAADHLQLVRYDSHGRLDTTSLVFGILDEEAAAGRVAFTFGAYVANFEAYLLDEWIRRSGPCVMGGGQSATAQCHDWQPPNASCYISFLCISVVQIGW